MKQCPQCQRTYADERLAYCLEDGISLVNIPNSFQPPPAITQPSSPRVKYTPSDTLQVPPAQFTVPFSPPNQTAVKSGGKVWIILSAVVILIILGGGVLAFFLLRDNINQPATNENANFNGRPVVSTSPTPTPAPTATQMVGSWKANVVENGVAQEITVTFSANGLSEYFFKIPKTGQTGKSNGSWRYSDGTLFETYSDGASGKGSIKWIDNDTFDITIIDNGVPAYNGIVRRYRRIK